MINIKKSNANKAKNVIANANAGKLTKNKAQQNKEKRLQTKTRTLIKKLKISKKIT